MWFQEFKQDFYPGESVTVILDNGDRLSGHVREKTKFPELKRADGITERKAFARYFVCLADRPSEEALVDEEHVVRDRKTFTKQRLRSFLKNTVSREAWTGAPWIVKAKIADEYRINTEIPNHLRYENQVAQRKANVSQKRGEFDGTLLNFYPPPGRLPELKAKGQKAKNAQIAQNAQLEARSRQDHFIEYQRALAGNPAFGKIEQTARPVQFTQFYNGQPGFAVNGYHPIAAKGQPKPQPPPTPKYPIEDLEIPPARDNTVRPAMKFLSQDKPSPEKPPSDGRGGILMESVGDLLETWNTLNVYCEVFQIDSFTFDDYVEALQLTSEEVQCELLVEVHCAVLKKLVNDVNDKNGQVQVSLPEPAQPEGEEESSNHDSSNAHTPTPEPEVKPSRRTTRSSLAKSEAAEMKESEKENSSAMIDLKIHRAAEMDRANEWKMRLRKRDLGDGKWVIIIVGLLNQLSGNARLRKSCDEILARLAPLDKEPTLDTAILQYAALDINLRVKILQILCTLSLETKAIRNYMEDCSNQMTDYRKDKIQVQRRRKEV